MTQTEQSCSLTVINKAENKPTQNKPEEEDNAKLLLAVYDSLDELYEKLNKLSNVIGKKVEKQNLSQKGEQK